MEAAIAVLVGLLVGTSAFLMLSRNLLRYLFGLILLGNAANLAIFAAGRLTYAEPPLIDPGALAPDGPVANALPQALILTAIVISFGLLAFALVLVYRGYQTLGVVDSDRLRVAEPKAEEEAGGAP